METTRVIMNKPGYTQANHLTLRGPMFQRSQLCLKKHIVEYILFLNSASYNYV